MELEQQAQWLKGFFDSLSNSESISKRQIEILSAKLEQLIISIESKKFNDNFDDSPLKDNKISNDYSSNNIEPIDDLPF
ncbi:MAG: hypothetical protein JST58_00665 [Bacteroidetes bacterium]|nr:hypothetical protein [Bacteroidota bacterium]